MFKTEVTSTVIVEVSPSSCCSLKLEGLYGNSGTHSEESLQRFPGAQLTPLQTTPLSVTPLSVTPLSVTPLSVAPLSVAPLSVAPLSVTPLSVTPPSSSGCPPSSPPSAG